MARERRLKLSLPRKYCRIASLGAVATLCISSSHPQGFVFPRKRLAVSPFSKGHGVKRQSLLSLSADSEILYAFYSAGDFPQKHCRLAPLERSQCSVFLHLIRVSSSATGSDTLLRPSPGEDSPTVWGKCHEVTKGDGSVRP